MFLRILLFAVLGFILFRMVRKFLIGLTGEEKQNKTKPKDDFQQKYKNKIEDADFEELE